MKDPGKFIIECKIHSATVGNMEVLLDELLEKRDNSETILETEKITLHIPSIT